MKTLCASFALLSLLVISGCSKNNDDPPIPRVNNPKKILQLKVDSSFSTAQSDDWVIAHDINGKLLEYKSFESGNLIILETIKDIPDNQANFTFFRYRPGSPNEHILETYLSNDTGQEWTLKTDPVFPANHGNKTGSFSASVSGVPEGSAYQISNRTGMIGGTSWGPGMLNFSGDLYDIGPSWLLYVADHTGTPKYKFYNNVINNSSFNETYSTLNNFDKTVTITFPPTKTSDIFYLVNSYEPGQSFNQNAYLTNSNFLNSYFARPNDLRSSITLGFLDMFTKNRIALDIKTSTYKYSYYRTGPTPDDITLPVNTVFTIPDKSLANFQFQSSQSFNYRTTTWHYQNTSTRLTWSVNAPQESVQKITELPAEFATNYPQLLISNLSHAGTSFVTSGETFGDLIDVKFKGKSKSDPYEIYSVSVY